MTDQWSKLETERYFRERASRANSKDIKRILSTAGTMVPQDGDEIPEGWLEDDDPTQ